MRSTRTSTASRRGIILLEVMLAVAIFCLVCLGLARAATLAADSLVQGNRETAIRLALDGEIAQAMTDPLVVGLQPTRTTDDGVAFEREWASLPLSSSDKTILSDLYTLTVRARWTANGKEQVEEASLTVYHPQS
ncbi:hypothetical protein SAMN05444156_1761 [Verrucomicrobium sp. GAS474]|uniref:hypothetical protein n=1 Tax=Verrucomicrobium sp. GAS474 TaxID=1882831 RepID=UPI00087CC438|nr:hypothetical protein [Verrucomicrobium sp. GAS474]SDU06592.1 hypothetical protein SAMN05444156_1761 [Verrucomicrobium sp. GAS474]